MNNTARKKRFDWKLLIGIAISAFFMTLALRKVDGTELVQAFKQANYWYVAPAILVMFLSHYIRALRWQLLIKPISTIPVKSLYSSLLIGYMANTFLPAHLGEFLRAYMVNKKHHIKTSRIFGTIVIERIIDVLTLLLLI